MDAVMYLNMVTRFESVGNIFLPAADLNFPGENLCFSTICGIGPQKKIALPEKTSSKSCGDRSGVKSQHWRYTTLKF